MILNMCVMFDYLFDINNWAKISSVISALGMSFITYYVYKLSSVNSKKDTYLQNIAKIVDQIELYYYALKKEKDEDKKQLLQRRIVTNCSMAVFYIQRFPGYNDKRLDLVCTFLYISKNLDDWYMDKLPSDFHDFCMEIKKNKRSSECHTFNSDKPGEKTESF